MKEIKQVAFHISFYYRLDRIKYLIQVIKNLQDLPCEKTIYVYTNHKVEHDIVKSSNIIIKLFHYHSGTGIWANRYIKKIPYSIDIIFQKIFGAHFYNHFLHKIGLTKIMNPYYLTWDNRYFVKKYVNKYDAQMYIEDDIEFDTEAFLYWIRYKNICQEYQYNLGFLRVEYNEDGEAFFSDLKALPQKIIKIEDQFFLLNDQQTYCAFWIYQQSELKKFINSQEWKFDFKGFKIREKSAIGWHALNMDHFKGTLIPLVDSGSNYFEIPESCLVHHLPNNYIGSAKYCKIQYPVRISKTGHLYEVK
jgi:hypothetical protein